MKRIYEQNKNLITDKGAIKRNETNSGAEKHNN
jgi:hypothetical protein